MKRWDDLQPSGMMQKKLLLKQRRHWNITKFHINILIPKSLVSDVQNTNSQLWVPPVSFLCIWIKFGVNITYFLWSTVSHILEEHLTWEHAIMHSYSTRFGAHFLYMFPWMKVPVLTGGSKEHFQGCWHWYHSRHYTAPCRTHTVRQHDLTRSLSTEQAQNRTQYTVNHQTYQWTDKSHKTLQIALNWNH